MKEIQKLPEPLAWEVLDFIENIELNTESKTDYQRKSNPLRIRQ
jgi:hypothetical protein